MANTAATAGREETIRKVYEFLQTQSTLVLSTRGAEGEVHSAPLFYLVTEGLELLWLSSADTQHSRDLLAEPQAAVSVFRPTFAWREIAGVQMRGVCQTVDNLEREALVVGFRERFGLGDEFASVIAGSRLYRFRPHWARLIDNMQGFGSKVKLEL